LPRTGAAVGSSKATELTEVEKRLVSHVMAGELLDLAPATPSDPIDEETVRLWGPEHEIRSGLLRDILRGRYMLEDGPDPHGLRLRGARIVGHLDLDFMTASIGVFLQSCHLPDGFSAANCHLPTLDLSGSIIVASFGGSDSSAVDLDGANIGGVLSMADAKLTNESGPALIADRVKVGNGMFLHGHFIATGRGDLGAVRLLGAQIRGQLSMRDATLINRSGPALLADGLNVDGDAFLDEGFSAAGYGSPGTLRLRGAQIGGSLALTSAKVTNEFGPAIDAENLAVGGNMSLANGFRAAGRYSDATVRLHGAKISGSLILDGANLSNDSGSALSADRAEVGGGMFFNDDFIATGVGDQGTVRLSGTQIAGQLSMRSAKLTNSSGPALSAGGVAVSRDAFLDNGFTATGHSNRGAVRLVRAQIGGILSMRGATIRNDSGPALFADDVTVRGNVLLDGGFAATGHGRAGTVRLPGARIEGTINTDAQSTRRAIAGMKWEVDGLVYLGLPAVGFDEWLQLLREGTLTYRPQPYQQLAASARAAGHDSDARRALIAQRDDQVKYGKLTPRAKAWAKFTKFALGYGYQPWRALIGVGLVLFISVLVVFLVPCALVQTETGAPCSGIQTFQIAVDMAIPLVSTSAETTCRVTSSVGGQVVAWVGVVLTLLGWALTALFAAGFTSAIRKP
jgi:hypothetical protein